MDANTPTSHTIPVAFTVAAADRESAAEVVARLLRALDNQDLEPAIETWSFALPEEQDCPECGADAGQPCNPLTCTGLPSLTDQIG